MVTMQLPCNLYIFYWIDIKTTHDQNNEIALSIEA
jgi:hypothetical protein